MYNQEAEQRILGLIIMNNDKLEALDFLEPKHFYFEAHAKLFKHLRKCITNDECRQDAVTLKTYFQLEKSMQELGGFEYLTQVLLIEAGNCFMISVKEYGRILVDLWQKRELFDAIQDIDKAKTLEEIKSDLMEKFDSLELENESEGLLVNDLMKDYVLRTVEKKEIGELINLHYEKLDKVLSGLYPANLVVLAGKTSMGKTAFALNLAKKIAQTTETRQGIMTYFLSIEMKNDEVLGRFLVEEASINGYRLRNGQLKPIEEQAALVAKHNFNLNLILDDSSGITVNQIWTRVKKAIKKYGVKVLFIDYLQKIVPTNPKDSRERQIGGIAEKLKDMAKKLDIVVVCLCQLSRENEKRQNKRPLLSDLRDSGSIEQESDVVLFVHRDDYYLEKEAEPPHSPNYNRWLEAYESVKGKGLIIVSKNRNGECGESEMTFNKEFQRFTEIN